jgi:hypothetical protein
MGEAGLYYFTATFQGYTSTTYCLIVLHFR